MIDNLHTAFSDAADEAARAARTAYDFQTYGPARVVYLENFFKGLKNTITSLSNNKLQVYYQTNLLRAPYPHLFVVNSSREFTRGPSCLDIRLANGDMGGLRFFVNEPIPLHPHRTVPLVIDGKEVAISNGAISLTEFDEQKLIGWLVEKIRPLLVTAQPPKGDEPKMA